MHITSLIFTRRDLQIVEDEMISQFLNQKGTVQIVRHLNRNAMTSLYHADFAVYKIDDNDYLVLKCRLDDSAGKRLDKESTESLMRLNIRL